jgi:hypothetical protein
MHPRFNATCSKIPRVIPNPMTSLNPADAAP